MTTGISSLKSCSCNQSSTPTPILRFLRGKDNWKRTQHSFVVTTFTGKHLTLFCWDNNKLLFFHKTSKHVYFTTPLITERPVKLHLCWVELCSLYSRTSCMLVENWGRKLVLQQHPTLNQALPLTLFWRVPLDLQLYKLFTDRCQLNQNHPLSWNNSVRGSKGFTSSFLSLAHACQFSLLPIPP